jgi:predicted transposase YdaD
LPRKKQEATKESKPYDSTLKALFGEQAEEMISCLLSDAHRPEGIPDNVLNVELNRNTLSIDVGRYIVYKGEAATFNLEAQSGPDNDLLPRMQEYGINLYRKYHRPTISVALLLFECEVPKVPFQMVCGGDVFSSFYPIVVCLWLMDAATVIERQQHCLYCLLPAMKDPTVHLLTQALHEMHERDSRPQFIRHLTWFQTILQRTTTLLYADKQHMQEVLKMQFNGETLLREDPVIHNLIAQGELKGELKGKIEGEIKALQEAILDIADDLFSFQVMAQIQQAIAPSQNIEQLKKFLRQLVRLSDEQEVSALLAQYFPLPGEIKGIQDAILDIASDRFSPEVVAHVQQTIAPSQDIQLLRKFHRQLVRLPDEQDVSALLSQCFPVS